ncbi:hypothetical protein [Aquirhabdus parva]|uniref:Uncharacterized protein n=1 Tax=Aquirhabdus parva TaxID=2283318 RepID=A0A345P2V5_9GAMM|nr:hypothetical protein [Aquirhabdus parva]AXI01614.1 hypothetical protein HYN46_01100 [Aquirhabdus parva]
MRQLFLFFLLLKSSIAIAADMPAQKLVTLSIDQDLITFLKACLWGGGIFLAIFSFIGLAFFGWDVSKAKGSLLDAQKEIRELLNESKANFSSMKELREKLEQLGAQLEENDITFAKEPVLKNNETRSPIDLIREVINSSNFEWTTIERVIKRTGLSRDAILNEVRKAPDIKISSGRKTQDFIFKIKTDK